MVSQSCCSHRACDKRWPALPTRFSLIRSHQWAVPDVQCGLEPRGAELDSDVARRAAAKNRLSSEPYDYVPLPAVWTQQADLAHDPSENGTHVVDLDLEVDLLIHGSWHSAQAHSAPATSCSEVCGKLAAVQSVAAVSAQLWSTCEDTLTCARWLLARVVNRRPQHPRYLNIRSLVSLFCTPYAAFSRQIINVL